VTAKALVTGGAGFIGSYLAEQLLDEGVEVWVLDDLSTGSLENVAHLRDRPGFHLVVDSVLHSTAVNELVYRCDVVYHLAAAVGVRLIVEQPVQTLVTNLRGTELVLEHCHRFGKRVLIASTSEVEATSTGLSKRRQASSTVSVPSRLTRSVRTGCSTIVFTPTAAARW